MLNSPIDRENIKTILATIIFVVAAVSVALKTWIPLIVLICTPLLLLIVAGIFAVILNSKKHVDIYIVPNNSEEKTIISEERFIKEKAKEKDVLH